MTDRDATPDTPPQPAPERADKSLREGLTGSAFVDAQPVNVSAEAPTEIPQAAISPQMSAPQASAGDGGSSGGGDSGGGTSE